MNRAEVQELNELLRADSIPAGLAETMFVCKLCETFCGIKQKAAVEPDYLKNHSNHKKFIKEQKRRWDFSPIKNVLFTSLNPILPNGSNIVNEPENFVERFLSWLQEWLVEPILWS